MNPCTEPRASSTASPSTPSTSRSRTIWAAFGTTLARTIFVLSFAILPFGAAQSLAELLPSETMLALGVSGLSEHADQFDDFIQEFEARGVGDALVQVFGDVGEDAPDISEQIPAALEGVEPLDVIGDEAWIGISASSFNPFPVATLIARMSDDATAAFGDVIAESAGRENVQQLTEGEIDFWVMLIEDADSPAQVLAYAQSDGLTILSSNPDVLRGVLRRMGGSNDPGFATAPGYDAIFGQLGDGDLYGYLDLGAVATALAPFTRGIGFAPLIERLQRALTTAGISGGVIRVVDEGIESVSLSLPNPAGGDDTLYDLLTAPGTYDPQTTRFVPGSALSFTTTNTDPAGWWNYLNQLVGSIPELGIQSLDQALMDFLGIDLRATFFDWTGDQLASVTTGATEVAEPGMAAGNLLGEQVYAIETIDETAARNGLSTLLQNVTLLVSSFADPSGGAGGAVVGQSTVEGVTVDTYRIAPGVELATAVLDGYALISTSIAAMEAALAAATMGAELPPVFRDLLDAVPSDAKGLVLTDSRATTEATAAQLASLVQLGSGFGGGSNIDFEAVTRASETLEGYVLFVASRLGGSVSYTSVENARIHTEGFTGVTW